ncbi:hypothetical protein SAMN02745704_02125 [Paucidesulfovibrio gracilis DSM 16080]|uniref:Uncharacterized protein n=1 Tax=Paucidesulfovibrio gracilis DSM 16080 TaxID=1121449 RepID=A0A1T4XIB2_9BACT|nr:hypothetical protein SAMN02745704_02125 [Paucidesulfovibrio gracilis DSM 16080]
MSQCLLFFFERTVEATKKNMDYAPIPDQKSMKYCGSTTRQTSARRDQSENSTRPTRLIRVGYPVVAMINTTGCSTMCVCRDEQQQGRREIPARGDLMVTIRYSGSNAASCVLEQPAMGGRGKAWPTVAGHPPMESMPLEQTRSFSARRARSSSSPRGLSRVARRTTSAA